MKSIAFATLLLVAVVVAAQLLKTQSAPIAPVAPVATQPVSVPTPVDPATDNKVLTTHELTVYADSLFPMCYTGGPVAAEAQRLLQATTALRQLPADHPDRKTVQAQYDEALAKVVAYNKANNAHQKQVADWVFQHEGMTRAQVLKETALQPAVKPEF